jgi:hypothetical protein
MTVEPNLAFLATRSPGYTINLESIEQAVQAGGFDIYGYQVGFGQQPSVRWTQSLSLAKNELQLAYEKRHLLMMLRDQDGVLEYRLNLNWWEEATLGKLRVHVGAVNFQTALFNGPDAAVHSGRLLHMGMVLYDAVRPDFGWTDLSDPAGYTWFDHIDKLAIPYLYWANFLSPSYVQRIGRGVLLSAPSWQTRELSDGGLLLVLSPAVGQMGTSLSKEAILSLIDPDRGMELPGP